MSNNGFIYIGAFDKEYTLEEFKRLDDNERRIIAESISPSEVVMLLSKTKHSCDEVLTKHVNSILTWLP